MILARCAASHTTCAAFVEQCEVYTSGKQYNRLLIQLLFQRVSGWDGVSLEEQISPSPSSCGRN